MKHSNLSTFILIIVMLGLVINTTSCTMTHQMDKEMEARLTEMEARLELATEEIQMLRIELGVAVDWIEENGPTFEQTAEEMGIYFAELNGRVWDPNDDDD